MEKNIILTLFILQES